MAVDFSTIKDDFPIFQRKINGKPIVYLDSGATSQKPQAVLDAMDDYYRNHSASVNRGCLLYTSPSPRDLSTSRMPSSA